MTAAALDNPIVAVEAVRRTLALAIEQMGEKIAAAVAGANKGAPIAVTDAADVLQKSRAFISDVSGPPESESEEFRLTGTLHALDHASRLAEIAGEEREFPKTQDGSDEARAAMICEEAMRDAVAAVHDIAHESALSDAAAPIDSLETPGANAALARLQKGARALGELQRAHRSETLKAVGGAAALTADQAMARIETVRRLEAMTRHAWRAASHLLGHSDA